MYNDSLKVANKIITYDDLIEIFSKMQEKIGNYQKINKIEEMKNSALDYRYQTWTFKDSGSRLYFSIEFQDYNRIEFDNYNNFITVFNNRLDEIKSVSANLSLCYNIQEEGRSSDYYFQSIGMWIYEDRMEISTSLSSADDKLTDIYELIKNKIYNAPPKYDEVIKKKGLITTIVTLGIGFIPALMISTLLIFVPTIRNIYSSSYILYPIASVFLAFVIGGTAGNSKLDKCYKCISPEKKYAGFDASSGKSYYKDDVDQYITTSEILIGKNINNLECRKEIRALKDKYKKWIPYELGVMVLISIIVLFL